LCIVVQKGQRASQRLFFYNNKLQVNDLTSNQVVGSSNFSGRTIFQRIVAVRAPVLRDLQLLGDKPVRLGHAEIMQALVDNVAPPQ
jgi:hypothetical protein